MCSLVATIFTLTKPSAISTQDNLAGNLHIPTLQRREESYTLSCTGVGFGGFVVFLLRTGHRGLPVYTRHSTPTFPHLFSSPQSHFRSDPFCDL